MGLEGGMTDRWVPLRVRKNALGNTEGGLAPKSGPSGWFSRNKGGRRAGRRVGGHRELKQMLLTFPPFPGRRMLRGQGAMTSTPAE